MRVPSFSLTGHGRLLALNHNIRDKLECPSRINDVKKFVVLVPVKKRATLAMSSLYFHNTIYSFRILG